MEDLSSLLGNSIFPLTVHALSTVERTRYALSLPDTSEDNWIALTINAFSEAFEAYCGRHFEQISFVNESYSSNTGRQYLVLKHRPVFGLITVMLDTAVISDFELESPESGILYRLAGWPNSRLVNGRGLQVGDRHPFAYRKNISVSYNSGYILPQNTTDTDPTHPVLPAQIERALWVEMGRAYGQRLAEGMLEQAPASKILERYNKVDFAPETIRLLNSFKEIYPGS